MAQLVIVPEITQDWSLVRIAQEAAPSCWEASFRYALPELEQIDRILAEEEAKFGKCCPLRRNIFQAFQLVPPEKARVVIIGQDPYHDRVWGAPRAQGLAFSVALHADIPPSLVNMFKELSKEYPGEFSTPAHGDLSGWAAQGVLLLNAALTVNPGKPGSHKNIWQGFLIKVLQTVRSDAIYWLLGDKAQSLEAHLSSKADILKTSHPSPFSVNRGFAGCGHFRQINELLVKKGQLPINWNLQI